MEETRKMTVIREAYENLQLPWDKIKGFVDYNGYIPAYVIIAESSINIQDHFVTVSILGKILPKSLMGIEDNNGWNVINWNQDSSDYIEDTLPEAEDTVLWIRALVGPGEAPVVASMIDSDFEGENYFTHWKPLEDKFPIY